MVVVGPSRLSGLGILFFLVVHITDTFFVVFAPDWYDHTVAIYGGIWFDGQYYWPLRWAFRVAELGLIASVVFHAVNGVGVILYDLWPNGALYTSSRSAGRSRSIFWGIMLVTTPIVLYPLRKAPDTTINAPMKGAKDVGPGSVPPTLTRANEPHWQDSSDMAARSMGRRIKPSGGYELFMWYFMRLSGLALVFLAVGHLFIMHILNNVETINYAFVAGRWTAPRTGWIWRLWDVSLISLAVIHGFNGLREVSL